MKGWKEIELKDFGKVITGKTPPTGDRTYFNGEYNFVSPKDMDFDSRYIEHTLTTVTSKAISKFKNQVLPKNSVMFTSLSYGFGKIGLSNAVCLTNQQINSIVVTEDKHDVNFVYYLLRYSKDRMLSYNAGIVTPIIPKSLFEKIKVFVPNHLIIEIKIGKILSAYDDLIENNLKRIKLLEELAQRTYEEWFLKFQVNGKQLKLSKETGLPEGWKKIMLSELIKFYKGKKANTIVNEYSEGLEKLLLLDGIENGKYPYTNPSDQVITERGDLIMLMDGARSSKVFFADKGVVGSTLSRIVITDISLPSSLLKQFFDANFDLMQANNTGAAIPHANKNFINSMLFTMPNKELLQTWKTMIDPIYEQIQNLKDQTLKLKESRDILLPKLMSGQIDVK